MNSFIVRMVPRKKERSYISIFRGSGCSSSVGRQGGVQKLKLGPNCVSSVGVVLHELMHAVGKIQLSRLFYNVANCQIR